MIKKIIFMLGILTLTLSYAQAMPLKVFNCTSACYDKLGCEGKCQSDCLENCYKKYNYNPVQAAAKRAASVKIGGECHAACGQNPGCPAPSAYAIGPSKCYQKCNKNCFKCAEACKNNSSCITNCMNKAKQGKL